VQSVLIVFYFEVVQEETVDTVKNILKDQTSNKGVSQDNGVEWKMQLHGLVVVIKSDVMEKRSWKCSGMRRATTTTT
jgi:hypothetical protein